MNNDQDRTGSLGGAMGGEPSADDLKSNIAETRARISEDLHAVADKFSPEHLKQQAREAVREGAEAIKDRVKEGVRDTTDAVVGRVRGVASDVSHRVSDVSHRVAEARG